ncbi:MAG: hypothetical protein QOF02_2629 [Blastocatellia bacterium]|jgi:hypothetical protein|nr:hypothetical protein [Blastocatellia bacterium]
MSATQQPAATIRNLTATAALCLLIIIITCAAAQARAQQTPAQQTPAPTASPTATPATTTTTTPAARPILKTIKLSVQYAPKTPAARKRFYVSRVDFDFDALQQKLGNLPSHKDYQQRVSNQSLSAELVGEFVREWLEKYKCETVYCQPITLEDVGRIRLFQDAYKRASELFKNSGGDGGAALRWLPNFLPREIATGYFDMKAQWLKLALDMMEARTIGGEQNLIRAFMTDRNGAAYIPEVKPGETYYISNLIPIEDGTDCFLWNKKQEVKAGPGVEVGVTLGANAKLKEIKGANAAALTFTCKPPK